MTLVPATPDPGVAAALANANGRVSFVCESDGTIRWVTPSVTRILGWDPGQLVGTSIFDLYDPTSRSYSERGFAQAQRDPAAASEQLGGVTRTARVRRADGMFASVESFPTTLLLVPEARCNLIEWIPVTDRRCLAQAIDSLALGRPVDETVGAVVQLVEALLTGVTAGVAVVEGGVWTLPLPPNGLDGHVVTSLFPSPQAAVWDDDFLLLDDETVGGWTGDDRGVGLSPLRTDDATLLGTLVLVRRRAERLPIVATGGENLYDLARRIGALALAAQRRDAEHRAAVEVDALTGLANRAALDRATDALEVEEPERTVVVVYADLDRFKAINDTFGHPVGDEVLRRFADRLRRALRDGDLACRIGGDEFVVVCHGRWHEAAVAALGRRLEATLNDGPHADGVPAVRASLGVAFGRGNDVRALLRAADARLYEAKRASCGSPAGASVAPV